MLFSKFRNDTETQIEFENLDTMISTYSTSFYHRIAYWNRLSRWKIARAHDIFEISNVMTVPGSGKWNYRENKALCIRSELKVLILNTLPLWANSERIFCYINDDVAKVLSVQRLQRPSIEFLIFVLRF